MKYNRVMLGLGGRLADECRLQGYIGAGFVKGIDLSAKLPDDWRKFNQEFRPVFLAQNPDKTMVAAGLACGMLYTIAKGLEVGDIVLCPNGRGEYYVGKIKVDLWNMLNNPEEVSVNLLKDVNVVIDHV